MLLIIFRGPHTKKEKKRKYKKISEENKKNISEKMTQAAQKMVKDWLRRLKYTKFEI
jgi:hypothetical protein